MLTRNMSTMETNEYREQRLANMRELEAVGYKPFGQAFPRTGNLAEIRADFAEDRAVSIAGRLLSIRKMGKSIFADLHDGTERFQVYAGKKDMGEEAFAAFKLLDVGDHVGVKGLLFVTRMGEQTLRIRTWTMLAKAVLPLPEKWHGLKDIEARYRQRYLDLVANPEVRDLFNKRIAVVREIRNFLHERGFSEVETPMMQPRAGGAVAKPFTAHYDALGSDMYLRIAPELYLKRLLTGGFDKVFELNRNFRNEGIDRTHIPEFTMLEIYEAYSDVRGIQQLVQDLVVHVAQSVFGTLTFGEGDAAIDLTPPWKEIPYRDLVKEHLGDNWFDLTVEEAESRAREHDLDIEPGWKHEDITHEIYEKVIERTLMQPVFVTRLPARLIPLAKTCDDDPSLADVFELEMGGREIAPGYSELNDPLLQRERFEQQAEGDPGRIDEGFLTALEHGMPPAGGTGIGIDRLMMLLTGAEAIRDVILFPQLKPKDTAKHPPE
jgi:lysyl-tRNA synthetase class 2